MQEQFILSYTIKKEKMNIKPAKKAFPALIILSLLTLVSAYSWGYSSPLDYLENEWVMFGAVFVLFFAIVFVAVNKSMKGNTGAAIVIALVVSLFISIAVARRGLLYSYAGEDIASWVLIIAVLLAIAFIIKVMSDTFGSFGGIAAVIVLWILLFFIKPYDIIPYSDIGNKIIGIHEFLTATAGGFILGLLVVAVIVALLYKFGGKKSKKRYYWTED